MMHFHPCTMITFPCAYTLAPSEFLPQQNHLNLSLIFQTEIFCLE